jgi:hypothetical protein
MERKVGVKWSGLYRRMPSFSKTISSKALNGPSYQKYSNLSLKIPLRIGSIAASGRSRRK